MRTLFLCKLLEQTEYKRGMVLRAGILKNKSTTVAYDGTEHHRLR